jgi:hypothetical protein
LKLTGKVANQLRNALKHAGLKQVEVLIVIIPAARAAQGRWGLHLFGWHFHFAAEPVVLRSPLAKWARQGLAVFNLDCHV